jgi:phage tail-like protein
MDELAQGLGLTSYPMVKFKFLVTFMGAGVMGYESFMEVSGINQEFAEETIAEGGVLDRVHKVPLGMAGGGDLTLKRGLIRGSLVRTWIQNAIQNYSFVPIQVNVSLLNELNLPVMTWTFNNVWPKKLEVDSFNSMENAIAAETLVLAYSWIDAPVV